MDIVIKFLVDAVVLMLLLQFLVGERRDFLKSLIAAVLGAVGAAGLTQIFSGSLGTHANLIAALIVAACIGVAVSLVFQVRIKTALIIGAIYVVIRTGVSYLLHALLGGV